MLLTLFLACAHPDTEEGVDSTDDTISTLDTAGRQSLAAHVVALEGAWLGEANPTPLGAFPFGIVLERKGEAIIGATKQLGTSITFAFEPDATYGFRFTETGTFGGFTQSYVLAPVTASAESVRWIAIDDPEVLEVVTTVSATSLVLEAWVRGEPHATLTFDRS